MTTEKPRSKKLFSLQTKILLLVVAIVFLQQLLSYIPIRKFQASLHRSQNLVVSNARDRVNRALTNLFFERYGDVQAFAVNPVFSMKNVKAAEDTLNTYVELYGVYQGILLFDVQGRLVAGNTKLPGGKPTNLDGIRFANYSNEKWFQAALREKFTEDSEKKITGTFVGEIGVDSISTKLAGATQYGFHFSAPIKNSAGQVVGVLTTRSDIGWMEDEGSRILDSLKTSAGVSTGKILISDNKGRLIFELDGNFNDPVKASVRNYSELGKLNVLDLNRRFPETRS